MARLTLDMPADNDAPRVRRQEDARTAPLLKSAARSRASQMPAVSQRITTRLVKAAKACGLERYDIIFDITGQVRLAVGSDHGLASGEAQQNDFDREFG